MKKALLLCLIAAISLLLVAPATSGDGHDMMAEMAKCHMCKSMVPHMAELTPVMKHDVIELGNGVAMMCTITDASKIDTYHAICDKMEAAGADLATFTPEQAKQKLCPLCQQMYGVMAKGATISAGKTADGHLLVINSNDDALQADIATLTAQWRAMMNTGI